MKILYVALAIIIALASPGFGQKPKTGATSGSTFEMTIEKDGHKTDIKSTQFEAADGFAAPADQGRILLYFAASNSKKDDQSFQFSGGVPAGATGTFLVGGSGPASGFTLMASAFPTVPIFGAEKGSSIEITASPTVGGFVVGTFQGTCLNLTPEGTIDKYTVSGSFKLARR